MSGAESTSEISRCDTTDTEIKVPSAENPQVGKFFSGSKHQPVNSLLRMEQVRIIDLRCSNIARNFALLIISVSLFIQLRFTSLKLVLRPVGSSGEHEGRFRKDPLTVFSSGGPCKLFWHGQGCPLFDVVHPAFPSPTTASPSLQGALKDGFGEAVMACNMTESCKVLFSTVARGGSREPARKLIIPRTQPAGV